MIPALRLRLVSWRSRAGFMVLAALAATCTLEAAAQAQSELVLARRHELVSRVLSETRSYWVHLPAGYERGTQRYPVIYLTDALAHFPHTATTTDFLARTGRIPQVIVVGVDNTDRTRDLTPPGNSLRGADGEAPVAVPGGGGADRFLDFFEQELIPQVEKTWRCERFRVFAGHSFGGLLAVHALATRPHLFNALIAVSPALAWDDDAPVKRLEALFARGEPRGKLLVTTIGELEPRGRVHRPFERLTRAAESAKVADFVFEGQVLKGEDHVSLVLRTHELGLRRVFADLVLPTDPATGEVTARSVADLERHYQRAAQRWGVSPTPPEAVVNQFGYARLGAGDHVQAVALFELNVRHWPDSANAHDSLGEGLEAAGRLEEARAAYARAVEKAAPEDAGLPVFKQHLEALTRRLAQEPKKP